MRTQSKNRAGRQAWTRGLAGFTGMAIACAVLASVTVLFDQAADMPWLPDTPSNVAAMQRCEGVQGTAARRACAEAVVGAMLAHHSATRLADNESAARARSPLQ